MSEPTRIGPELALRRTLQRQRGEYARERDYDRMVAEANACQGECTAPGSTRGGVLLGDGSTTRGLVAVDERSHPCTAYPAPGAPTPPTRPCFDCNRERWEAWQAGQLASKKRQKVESHEDRQVAQQRARRAEQASFR